MSFCRHSSRASKLLCSTGLVRPGLDHSVRRQQRNQLAQYARWIARITPRAGMLDLPMENLPSSICRKSAASCALSPLLAESAELASSSDGSGVAALRLACVIREAGVLLFAACVQCCLQLSVHELVPKHGLEVCHQGSSSRWLPTLPDECIQVDPFSFLHRGPAPSFLSKGWPGPVGLWRWRSWWMQSLGETSAS